MGFPRPMRSIVFLAAPSAEFPEPNQTDPTRPAPSEKTFRYRRRANHRYPFGHPPRQEGRIAIVTDAGLDAVDAAASGAMVVAGRVLPVSDRALRRRPALQGPSPGFRSASPIGVLTRGRCVRRSRVVLASVADVKPAETRRPDRAQDKSQSAGDGGKKEIRRRGEHV